jgi:hypothetical protein
MADERRLTDPAQVPARERKKLLLRLDPQVYDAVARWAADDLRSVNAQIEYALRLALRNVGRSVREQPEQT